MTEHERPPDAEKIPRVTFDGHARAGRFSDGPWLSSFGDGPGEPYVPPSRRSVWGRLRANGRAYWADGE